MNSSWIVPKIKVNGDILIWYEENKLLISKTFLIFSESFTDDKWPKDVLELVHKENKNYRVIISITSKENLKQVLEKCREIFVENEEYELAHRTKIISLI